MAGLDDINIDNLSLDQMDALSRGETAGLLPEVSPVSDAQPEPRPEPAKDVAKAEPVAKADDKTPAPATDADDDEPAPADPNNATIPYQKYAREKKELKRLLHSLETKMVEQQDATAKERQEMHAKWARADERLKVLSDVMMPPAAGAEQVQEDIEPDPAQDIIAWVNWQRRELARVKEGVGQTQQTFQETRADQQLRDVYQRDMASYAAEVKHLPQAYNHLLMSRAKMLQRQGYQEPQIIQIIQAEEKGLVKRAIEQGKRPAQAILEAAEDFGFRAPDPQSAVPAAQAAAAVTSNGANGHANGAAAPAAQSSVVEEVERIQRGMAGAKSLADVGGSTQEISVEALASMGDREFAAYYAKHQARVDALMGKGR